MAKKSLVNKQKRKPKFPIFPKVRKRSGWWVNPRKSSPMLCSIPLS